MYSQAPRPPSAPSISCSAAFNRFPKRARSLIYARLNHPNAEILEDQLVPLERGAAAAAVFNSGMAAIFTVLLGLLERDSALIYTQPLYGGTQNLIHEIIEPLGFIARPVKAGDTQALADTITHTDNLKLVLIETPSNPTLSMTDIAAAASAVRLRPNRPFWQSITRCSGRPSSIPSFTAPIW